MLRIILCEDDEDCRKILKDQINCALFDKEEVYFECYGDGSELVQRIERGEELFADFIFLDIHMPVLDGISTARMLKKYQIDAKIVFVTVHGQYVYQGYEVHAYDYLLKPVAADRLKGLFSRYFQERELENCEYFTVNHRYRKERIPIKHIRYFLSDKRKIKVILEEPYTATEFYMKMSELEEQLNKFGFLRCHQSYLVNARKILNLDTTELVLTRMERIPVSKKYCNELKRFFY